MDKSDEFSFGDNSVAKAYDQILVPTLFEPWAKSLINKNKPWIGKNVLDLACGTGVVTKELVQNVIPEGKVIALDISKQMLDVAKIKCAKWINHIEFKEGSADSLDITDKSIDKVICQQGFQFFPNKKVVAQEIYRVLKPGGRAILSTWCPVSECEIFGAICETLESLDLSDLSQLMRIPFDFMTQTDLLDSFNRIGFSSIQISKQKQKMNIKGEIVKTISFAYSTPIGPKLNTLNYKKQEEFKRIFMNKIRQLKQKDGSYGNMVSNVLKVEK